MVNGEQGMVIGVNYKLEYQQEVQTMASKSDESDGIYLSKHKSHELDMALISLRIGFEAYYSTYQSVKGQLRDFEIRPSRFGSLTEEEINYRAEETNLNLTKAYIEIIFHFHHFIEVSIKEILRQEHELLASKADNHDVILHKLLRIQENEDGITQSEKESLQSLEFSTAKKRLINLITAKRIANHQNMAFVNSSSSFLDKLNNLRNRLVHRGVYMLHYKELDVLVGNDIFPFIKNLLNLPIYKDKDNEFQWQPKKLHCKIDLIQEINKECKKPKYNIHKVAFLKEMGRAAFVNPLPVKDINKGMSTVVTTQKDAEKQAEEAADDALDIQVCPVCGAKSLARYWDRPDPDDEEIVIYQVTCFCCTFSVNDELNDVKVEGLDIKKMWQAI